MTITDSESEIRGAIERRKYWSEKLDQSADLLHAMTLYPVEECGEELVSIKDAVSDESVEMLFSDTKIANTFDRLFFIRKGIISDLISAGRRMNDLGWILKIEEGFRTLDMQIALGRSPKVLDQIVKICSLEASGETPPIALVSKRAKCLVANTPCTGTHMCGAAVDISVHSRDTGEEIWRGASYLNMSELTPMASPFVSLDDQEIRQAITRVMEENGFYHYPTEFWHYNNGDALSQMLAQTGLPGRYGPVHWDPKTNKVAPYEDCLMELTPLSVLEGLLEQSLARYHDNDLLS